LGGVPREEPWDQKRRKLPERNGGDGTENGSSSPRETIRTRRQTGGPQEENGSAPQKGKKKKTETRREIKKKKKKGNRNKNIKTLKKNQKGRTGDPSA